MVFNEVIDKVGLVIDGAGVVVVIGGAVVALGTAAVRLAHRAAGIYRRLREQLGHTILLGLELLVAGDIVRTVAAQPTLTSVAILAAIVLIRTFLSFSLEVEISGRWPWQKAVTGPTLAQPAPAHPALNPRPRVGAWRARA
jgi:uncharacterized membrane protein